MSDFNNTVPQVGFSTGALERGNFRKAVDWMINHHIHTVELSALRIDELQPLVDALNDINLKSFGYISFHAPSSFEKKQEGMVIEMLEPIRKLGWNIIVHPDVIYSPSRWSLFGEQLLIENMDRRKAIGRNTDELKGLFKKLPKARLCLDVAHARQMDTTLTLLWNIAHTFMDRIGEVHISELDSCCHHQPMSRNAMIDYKQVLGHSLRGVPVIVESMLDADRSSLRMKELSFALEAIENE